MTYRATDVVAFLRELFESMGEDQSVEARTENLIHGLGEEFPELTTEEFARAHRVYMHDVEARQAEAQAEIEAIEQRIAFFERHEIPSDRGWKDAVQMVAERGDPEAEHLWAELNSAASAVGYALLYAAIDAHPAWSRDGHYFTHDTRLGGPTDDEELVDWYQRTYPREARALTDRVEQDHREQP